MALSRILAAKMRIADKLSTIAPFRKPEAVYGHRIAPPAPTWAGVWMAVKLFGPPALAFILLMDLIVWAIAEALFGACVAMWCAF